MVDAVAHQQVQRIAACQAFQRHGSQIFGEGGLGTAPFVATCASEGDAQALVDLLNSFQRAPTAQEQASRPEWFERRGSMVYGEDTGPGTAPHIATCQTANDANTVVMILCELAS